MDQLGVRLLRVLGWLLCSAAVPLCLSPMHGYVFRKASDPWGGVYGVSLCTHPVLLSHAELLAGGW